MFRHTTFGGLLAALLLAAPLIAAPAVAQDAGQAQVTDAQLLADVNAALPPGVTLDTATEDQIAAAINAVIAAQAAPVAGAAPPDVSAITVQVLSVVSVTLDAVGRSAAGSTVQNTVIATLPPQQQAVAQQSVQTARANPSPSQVVAAGAFIAGTLPPPAAGPADTPVVETPVVDEPVVLVLDTTDTTVTQDTFQENANQVSSN